LELYRMSRLLQDRVTTAFGHTRTVTESLACDLSDYETKS